MAASNDTPVDGAASLTSTLTRTPDPLVGRVINDRYRIISLIARGGMGKVYRAEQAALGRPVALKILNPGYTSESDPDFQKRFFLEAATSSKLRHPNTVTIYDYGKTDDEVYYIAMELLEGRTLHRALQEEGTLSPQRTMLIASEICRSLREAHSKGVVHRDLKPANVYLVRHDDRDANEAVKVLDFGLVKNVEEGGEQLTKTGVFMGSPKYMAPEQIRDEPTDPRVDVYGLGVVMYEMLTGQTPFDRSTSVNTLMAHLTDPVRPMKSVNPNVDVPVQLEQIVRRCLEKAPEDRFATMNDLLHALQMCASNGAALAVSGDFALGDSLVPSLRNPSGHGSGPIVLQDGSGAPSVVEELKGEPDAPFAQATKGGVALAPLFLAALFALTGVAGFVVLSRPFDATPPPESTSASDTQAARPSSPDGPNAAAERPAPPKKLVIALRSTPPGAIVVVGTRKYGPTPLHVVWTGEDAAEGRIVTFRFQLKGYRDLTLTQEVHGDRLEVEGPPMERLEPERGRRR